MIYKGFIIIFLKIINCFPPHFLLLVPPTARALVLMTTLLTLLFMFPNNPKIYVLLYYR